MSGPVQQEDFGRGSSFGKDVLHALIAGAAVHVLDGDGDVEGQGQGDDVDVVRLLVHGLHFLVAEILDATSAVHEVGEMIRVFLQLTGSDETQEHDQVIGKALVVEGGQQPVDGGGGGGGDGIQLLHGFDEGVVEVLDGELREAEGGDEQILHVRTALLEGLPLGRRHGLGSGRRRVREKEEILEVGETEGTKEAIPVAASPTQRGITRLEILGGGEGAGEGNTKYLKTLQKQSRK